MNEMILQTQKLTTKVKICICLVNHYHGKIKVSNVDLKIVRLVIVFLCVTCASIPLAQ